MSRFITIGPITILVSRKGLADWGYERVQIGGLRLGSRCSDGSLMLASYHPSHSATWHWSVSLTRKQPGLKRAFSIAEKRWRTGQWHDYVKLPFGWALCVSRQDYHKRPSKSSGEAA